MIKRWLSLSIVVGLVLVLVPPVWSDYQAGVDAYERGDYEYALQELRPLADQGDAAAQYKMGVMYHKGQGVSQDYQEAMKWLRLTLEEFIKKFQLEGP